MSLSHRIALASAVIFAILFFLPVQAQIVPDGTLGTQAIGACAGAGGTCGIINGTARGSDLFHSFLQFSLPNGDVAAFIINPTIQNLIVRVTGVGLPFISNINGAIATTDPTLTNIIPTNFFLLNPNGIVFGPSARIFVGGSFLASTAERMLFQDGTMFDTRDQTLKPLLTVSVPTGLQFGQTPGEIRSGMQIVAGFNSRLTDFSLVGGNVTLDDSRVSAPGGRIELGGVGENGTVGLRQNGDRLSLSLAASTPRRDITLTNGSTLDAGASTGSGEVVVMGRNISLYASSIFTGILPGIDNAATNQAGNITISAIASLKLTKSSRIANTVNSDAIGQGGNIHIAAADIRVGDGSGIGAVTNGNGNGGNVQVTTNSITLDGDTLNDQVARIGTLVD